MYYLRSGIVLRPAVGQSWIVVLVGDNLFGIEEYQFVGAWKVLHATGSFESHYWQTGTTSVVVLL
jgi:hypothetical protein